MFESLPRYQVLRPSFNGQDCRLRTCGSEFKSPGAYHRPFVQSGQDAALRTPKFRFNSGEADQSLRIGGRPARHSAVYRDYAGSTPVRCAMRSLASGLSRLVLTQAIAGSNPADLAKFYGVEHDRTSALAFTQVIDGSIPSYPTIGP